ncbi:hypothetical protein MKY64_15650 [Paenibacillus sp. FSL R7-0210]|uniref:hypothetical protein n=1 Tax=Paenibacillus sp. FSL R7-0210 TaxID=2921676 RepID=UPI0030FB9984
MSNRSGYNRSTFYQYFTDIYELLDAVESNLLLDIKTELADKELSMHSVQDALSCLDKKEHLHGAIPEPSAKPCLNAVFH